MRNVFVLKIRLGNEAMKNVEHVIGALFKTATLMAHHTPQRAVDMHGKVIDENGNTVGGYSVEAEVVHDDNDRT